ncbi:Acetyltransferase (GNAT) family [Seminavis robusta]|uniref:Acetyltransferase (GNAT) family n=1 Tax=Seminavis robusta TaxID=568900 RepID=A0A9N8DCB8_9STRA|nr:Acetyltransferase (GNAT) family [Seminavis robusta]|eukprot:Sro32_g021010.1 Acetyltransferase (GNAT) family (227) ;mRNA; r:133247-133927
MTTKPSVLIRPARADDASDLLYLHQLAAVDPQGLVRQPQEITLEFIVEGFLLPCLQSGIILVAELPVEEDDNEDEHDCKTKQQRIVGDMHALNPTSPIAFQHLLTDVSIAVLPSVQGQGIGRKLFQDFFHRIPTHIARVELYTLSTNARNVQFYERMGFVNEGTQTNRIFYYDCDQTDGKAVQEAEEEDEAAAELRTPIHMAWLNPNFDMKELLLHHKKSLKKHVT